jgi:signal peptide peptidase SppA
MKQFYTIKNHEMAELVSNQPLAVDPDRMMAYLRAWQLQGVTIDPQSWNSADTDSVPLQAFTPGATSDGRPPYSVAFGSIAIIEVAGPLINRENFWACMTSYEDLRMQLRHAESSSAIQGIVLRFDTPGGETAGAFDLADDIRLASKTKPVWASVDDHCYSAGYLLASQCNRIFVTKTGGVGSVGVIAWHIDQSGWDKEIGVKVTTIFAGDRKNDFNPHEKLSDPARDRLQSSVNRLYGMFTESVARGRKMSVDAVKATQAGTFDGAELAIEAKFADREGTFESAVKELAAELGIVPQQLSGDMNIRAESQAAQEGIQMKHQEANAAEQEEPKPEKPVDDDEEAPEMEKEKEKPMSETVKTEQNTPVPTPHASMEEVINLAAIAGMSADQAMELFNKKLTTAALSTEIISMMKQAQSPSATTRQSAIKGGTAIAALESAALAAGPVGSAAYAKAYVDGLTNQSYNEYLAANSPRVVHDAA